MNIAGLVGRGKALIASVPQGAYLLVVLILAASASFGLGYLAGRDQVVGQGGAFTLELAQPATQQVAAVGAAEAGATGKPARPDADHSGGYVASKNGTKYYLPSCSGAKRISDANKVWFATKEAVEAEGYTPARNCAGL